MAQRFASITFAVLTTLIAARASADRPNSGDCRRPFSEISTWIPIAGGAAVPENGRADGVFYTGFGYDWTFPLAFDGDLRFGPWGSAETADFISLQLAGGLEILGGRVPSIIDLFQYEGEGILLLRAGAGWALRDESHGNDGAVLIGSLAWGYRAPWNRWDRWSCGEDHEDRRAPQRYMIGVRFFVTGSLGIREERSWLVVGGIEFEPVGAFRYFFGLR